MSATQDKVLAVLALLAEHGEQERIEVKRSSEAGKSLLETICALSNEPLPFTYPPRALPDPCNHLWRALINQVGLTQLSAERGANGVTQRRRDAKAQRAKCRG